MKSLRTMLLLGSMVFAMGAVAGCGDDDDGGNPDAPVSVVDAPVADGGARDAAVRDAAAADSRVTDAAPRD
jgi:hypothetical protein